MLTPILATKFYVPPPRPGAVLRPKLIERLNEGLGQDGDSGHKLTLISAPAGFGKTSIVSEWAAGRNRLEPKVRVAWLSLDEGDNDPKCFLTYLVAALRTVAPKIGEGALAALQSPQPPPFESILTALLNEITTVSDDFILVLDDYHVIESQPLNQALTFLIEHLPSQLHLVIATREDPPFPLARWRVRGQLTEMRAADLRFTPAEAAQFLNGVMGLKLSAQDIAALENRTEGWIAGLQLAALSLQGRENITGFIQAFSGSHRFVLDYLVEEVLQSQPEPIRQFLLQTSILDTFCAALCNAVTEREDSRATLDVLERSNLFLIPLDDGRRWYRYHHLFADVLQTHLVEAQPDRLGILHKRASEWYKHNGSTDDAVRHALAAGDFKGAAELIELAWTSVEDGSLSKKWLGWAKSLPDELVRARPVLSVWYASALLGSGDLKSADARLMDAEGWLEPGNNPDKRPKYLPAEMAVANEEQLRSLPATIAITRAYLAQAFGDVPGTVLFARRALDLIPAKDYLRRGQATGLLGLAYWVSGDLESSGRTFAEYTIMLRSAGSILDAIGTTIVLADIRMASGCLNEAVSTLEQSLQFMAGQGQPIPPDAAELYRGLGELSLEQGNPEAAAQYLLRSKELGEKAESAVWWYRWRIAQARLTETRGDLDSALKLLNEAERLFIRTPLPDVRPISALRARIWIRQGRLVDALAWARERNLSVDDKLSYLHEFEHITLTGILIAQYRNERLDCAIHSAIQLLERLLQAAENGRRNGSAIEILVMQSLAYQAQGSIELALMPLERALKLAEPESYVRIFTDEGQPMTELLTRLKTKVRTPRVGEYILKLLSTFSIPLVEKNGASLPAKQAVSSQSLIEPLSERELEVLRLLRTDLSGPEIARECMVSLTTVRTHTQNIYTKLGVNNRRAAVHRAEELDLF